MSLARVRTQTARSGGDWRTNHTNHEVTCTLTQVNLRDELRRQIFKLKFQNPMSFTVTSKEKKILLKVAFFRETVGISKYWPILHGCYKP